MTLGSQDKFVKVEEGVSKGPTRARGVLEFLEDLPGGKSATPTHLHLQTRSGRRKELPLAAATHPSGYPTRQERY